MKKTLSMVAILLAIVGFLYSAVHIFGTGIKYFEYRDKVYLDSK